MSGRAAERAAVPCPIGRAAEVVGDRWTLLILRDAMVGVTRFDAFRAGLGIADNILSNRLGRLVDGGLLTKVPYREGGRTRHEYRLTPAGADLLPVLDALAVWGGRHTAPGRPAEAMRVLHAVCGRELTAGEYCGHCARPVPLEEIHWLRPWRSAEPRAIAAPVNGG
ncbi:helix-turn-helix domain-containing protein [Streptomyces sp. SL13]|uniref:Helix-turn-helix domain-containing protein n=1 Tax=Streptantibioticus silvisoli TaxID=2705255 RepID=A0AA90H1T2_9ACTN|nr:helix-turn-helix domain-containing protein [Streptantibioticus silvisoli]MDI5969070.1 helix-turn-helix domain-containing protein [Streptantibioticus silvisoli]